MAGKEKPQPEGLDPKHLNHLKKLDAKANHHLEYNDLVKKLPEYIEQLDQRKLGRVIEAAFYDSNDDDKIIAKERVGYALPSKIDEKGKVIQSVVLLKNGLIMQLEPRSERSINLFQNFAPNSFTHEIDLPYERKSEVMNDVGNRIQNEGKLILSSEHENQLEDTLDALDNATVFAWNLKKSKERSIAKSAKGVVTIFERFLKAYDTEPLDPPKDMPPTQEQPPVND